MFVTQSNVLDRAVDWIFSHLDDLESMDVSEGGRSAAESEGGRDPPPGPRVRDGPGSKSIGGDGKRRNNLYNQIVSAHGSLDYVNKVL